jgi:small subunit ribosomal protein S20
MAHHKSALKRIRQSKKLKIYNRQNKKTLKMAIRSVREAKTFEEASEKFKIVSRVLDKTSARHIIHKNFAANKKSALSKFVYSLKTEVAAV